MTTNQLLYSEFLQRQCRNKSITIQEANKLKLNRLVGEEYGLSESEMDEAVSETTI